MVKSARFYKISINYPSCCPHGRLTEIFGNFGVHPDDLVHGTFAALRGPSIDPILKVHVVSQGGEEIIHPGHDF